MHTRTMSRPLRLGLPALLLTLLTVIAPAGPAQAHDRLVSSDPTAGATLDAAPEEITLTFSAAVQDIGGSVDLADGDGGVISVGSPTTEGTTVTTPIDEELAAGDYQARWRVVSSDGHPISGTIDFTVEEGETSTSSSSSSAPSTAPSESASASPTAAASSEDRSEAADDSGTSPVVVSLGVAAAVIVLGGLAGLVLRRRRRNS